MKVTVRGGAGPVDPKPPRRAYADLIEGALILGSYGTKHLLVERPEGEREALAKLRAYRRVLRVYVNPFRLIPVWVRLTKDSFVIEERAP